MSKIIKFDEDARRGMESGLNLLADTPFVSRADSAILTW